MQLQKKLRPSGVCVLVDIEQQRARIVPLVKGTQNTLGTMFLHLVPREHLWLVYLVSRLLRFNALVHNLVGPARPPVGAVIARVPQGLRGVSILFVYIFGCFFHLVRKAERALVCGRQRRRSLTTNKEASATPYVRGLAPTDVVFTSTSSHDRHTSIVERCVCCATPLPPC